MAYTYLSLRRKLSDKLHEDDLFEILYEAQGIEDNPMKRNLYRLLFDEDKRVSDNNGFTASTMNWWMKPCGQTAAPNAACCYLFCFANLSRQPPFGRISLTSV